MKRKSGTLCLCGGGPRSKNAAGSGSPRGRVSEPGSSPGHATESIGDASESRPDSAEASFSTWGQPQSFEPGSEGVRFPGASCRSEGGESFFGQCPHDSFEGAFSSSQCFCAQQHTGTLKSVLQEKTRTSTLD